MFVSNIVYLRKCVCLQPIKFLCDWVVAKGVTVGETKKEILEEISTRCGIKIPFDRLFIN